MFCNIHFHLISQPFFNCFKHSYTQILAIHRTINSSSHSNLSHLLNGTLIAQLLFVVNKKKVISDLSYPSSGVNIAIFSSMLSSTLTYIAFLISSNKELSYHSSDINIAIFSSMLSSTFIYILAIIHLIPTLQSQIQLSFV